MPIFVETLIVSIFQTVFAKLSITTILVVFFAVPEHDIFLSHRESLRIRSRNSLD